MRSKAHPRLRVVTNSEISAHACPRLHELRYVRRLSPSEFGPTPAARGTLTHRLISADARSDDEIAAIVEPWVEERVAYAPGSYDSETDPMDEGALLAGSEVAATAERITSIFRRYRDRWSEEDEHRYETIASEAQFSRLILDDKGKPIRDVHVDENGRRITRTYVYGGAVDRVVRDTETGLAWLVETKTTKERDLEAYTRKLSHDAQTRGYVWGLADPIPWASEITEPIRIVGVIYDVIRDKLPTLPEPLAKCVCKHPQSKHENGRCNGSQKCECMRFQSIGFSQREFDTTWPVYRDAVIRAGFDPSDYDEVRQRLIGAEDGFFRRVRYPFTTDEIERFGSYARSWALRTKEAEKRARIGLSSPPNSSVCLTSKFGRCPGGFEGACLIGNEADDLALAAFAPRGIRHVELHGVLAEEIGTGPMVSTSSDTTSDLVRFGGQKVDDTALPF